MGVAMKRKKVLKKEKRKIDFKKGKKKKTVRKQLHKGEMSDIILWLNFAKPNGKVT